MDIPLGTWLTLAGFTLQTVVLIVGGVYKVTEIKDDLKTGMIAMAAKFSDELTEVRRHSEDECHRIRRESIEQAVTLRKEFNEQVDRTKREFGETVQAMRQKVADVELWGRDNFIRNETFNDALNKLADRIENRLDKLDVKFDSMRD